MPTVKELLKWTIFVLMFGLMLGFADTNPPAAFVLILVMILYYWLFLREET